MKHFFKKILFTLLIIFTLIILSRNNAFAFSNLQNDIQDPRKTPPEGKILEIVNPILTLIQIISIGISTGLIIIDGIKLLTTTDNSEKANLKRKLFYYIVGGILVFAPTTVFKYLSSLSTSIIK